MIEAEKQGELTMDTNLYQAHGFDSRAETAGILVVLANVLVSALCYAYILHAGIVIAE